MIPYFLLENDDVAVSVVTDTGTHTHKPSTVTLWSMHRGLTSSGAPRDTRITGHICILALQ